MTWMRRARWFSAAFAAAAVLLAPAAHAGAPQSGSDAGAAVTGPDLDARLKALCDTLEQRRIDQHIPSMAIAIVKDDRVVLARGFGTRDLETSEPADAQTLYAIGSQSKAFTTMLISMLADEGKLSWDGHVRSYVPGFKLFDPVADEQVTLRDLCSHRTGLPRTDLHWASGKATKQQMMECLASAEPTAKFREQWQYNNTMFMVAGLAAQSVAGSPWPELIKARIFEPLGMQSSNTHIREMQSSPQAAKGYLWDTDRNEHKKLPMREVTCDAAGAINSTAQDMAQWLRLLLGKGSIDGKRLVSEEKIDLMWTRQIAMGPGAGYGLGWMLGEWNGRRQVDHGGNIDGFFCALGMLPEEKLGVVLLGSLTFAPLQGEVLPLVWETFFPSAPTGDAPMRASELQEYVGKYRADLINVDCAVNIKDGTLHFDVPGQTNYQLNWPDADGKWAFTLMPQAIQLKFNRNAEGKIVSLTSFQGGLEMVCPRLGDDGQPLEAAAPAGDPMFTREQLIEYTGSYHFGPSNDQWKVIINKDVLAVDVPRQRVFNLRWPDADGRWAVEIAPKMMSCRFNRGADGKITSMTWIQGGEIELPRTADIDLSLPPTVDEVRSLRDASANPEKVRAMGDVEFSGRVRCVNQGIEGSVIIRANADGRFYQNIDFGTFGFIRMAYDGEHGWSHSVGEAFTELAGERLDEARRSASQYLVVDLRELFDTLRVEERATLDGVDVIVVSGTTEKPKRTSKQYLDAKTGLPLKEETTLILPGIGKIPLRITYGGYRDVEGVQFPTLITIHNEASGTMTLTIDAITPRVQADPEAYRLAPTASSAD
ncbi:MAG: hypothetical protein AMXMBFR58_01410 [Phycisphaerae bacterium]